MNWSVYAESAYFDGDHCAHCVAWEEHMRLAYVRARALSLINRR